MVVKKRILAVVMALVMMFGLFPTSFIPSAYAEVHTEDNGIGLGGNNARLTNKYTGNTGTLYGINNHILGGAQAFCIDPTIGSEVGANYTYTGTGDSSSNSYWNRIGADDKKLLAGIATYYANNPNASYLTPNMGHQPATIAKVGAQYAVFASVVSNPDTLNDRVDSYAWSDVKQYAAEAISWAQSQGSASQLSIAAPSFDGQAVELVYDPSSEMYVGSVTDSNGALSGEGYNFSQTVSGVRVAQNGNTVTISATPAAAVAAGLQNRSNSWAASATVSKTSDDPINLGSIKIYERPGDQPLMVYEPSGSGPSTVSKTATVRAYANLIGSAKVRKRSSLPSISNSNSCYTLSGAIYAVYSSEAEARAEINALAMITTNSSGESETVDLAAGDYYLKEISSPRGYALSEEIIPFSVSAGQTVTVQTEDIPVSDPIPVLLRKIDESTGEARPAGNMSLEGAEFHVSFYGGQYSSAEQAEANGSPIRSWIIKTDADGYSDMRDPAYIVSGDELWYGASNEVSLPLGSVVIYETKAPDGYKLNPTHYIVNITEDGTGSSVVRTYNAPDVPESPYLGGVTVQKADSDQRSAQGEATLADAKFGLINENSSSVTINGVETAPGGVALIIETDADGFAYSGQVIPFGSYSLIEVQPSEGYELNSAWSSGVFTISENEQVIDAGTCPETIVRGGISVQKTDADLQTATPYGDASFENTVFTVINQSSNSVMVNGVSYSSGETVMQITTDASGFATTGNGVLPFGQYLVMEESTEAGNGYSVNLDYSSTVFVSESQVFGAENCGNKADFFGGVAVQKLDKSSGSALPQGDAELEGAEFEIINRSANPVIVSGVSYGVNDVVATIRTDANGLAQSNINLPKGTYSIREFSPSEGYRINSSWEKSFAVREKGKVYSFSAGDSCEEELIYGSLAVQKVDSDTMTPVPQGGATLAGAEIQVINASKHPVLINGTSYKAGDVITVITTNEQGFAATDAGFLPYGSYELVETKAPKGYGINLDWNPTVEIRDDSQVLLADDLALVDDVARGDITFVKVDGSNMQRLKNIPFLITSQATGESHVAVTDNNGVFSSATLEKTSKVNGNDAALNGDTVDETQLDSSCGIWFYGENSEKAPRNEKGAFPYDTYVFRELPVSANAMYELVSFEVSVTLDGQLIDIGTVDDNPVPHVTTELLDHDTNDHIAAAAAVTLNDRINYYALQRGKTYEIRGTLVDRDSGEPIIVNGNQVTAVSGEIQPGSAEGSVTLSYSLDASELAGKTVVSVAELIEDGVRVYVDDDLSNASETVYFPQIRTVAHGRNGEKEFAAENNTLIIDTVSYSNLIPGTTYTLKGQLVDATTGTSPVDKDGNAVEITAETVFRAEEENGSVDMEFLFDASRLPGGTLVAFESLLRNSVVIAEHKDTSDTDQTVTVPVIATTLLSENKSHITPAVSEITLKDTVTYSGLQPGMSYIMTGTLMDKSTGEKAADAYGQEITSSTSFTANPSGAGVVELTFVFNGTNLAGTAVVAFEEVYGNGYLVCSHADLDDEDQTVWLPRIRTNAFGSGEDKEVFASENGVIHDIVAYWSLTPGKEYTLTGTLTDKVTGEPALDPDGNPIISSVSFIPEAKDGSETVTFEADLSDLAGHTLVVFETLATDGEIIAEHKDPEDAGQTVTLPKIWTLAHSEDGSHEMLADNRITIIDTVMYENLVAGKTYTVTGTLMDKNTGRPVRDRHGDTVTATSTFEASAANGSVDVTFVFDASDLKNSTLVAFEQLRNEVVLVSVHEDIDDEDQTIRIPEIATTLLTDTGTHVVPAGETVTLTDTVEFHNLTAGNTYTVSGILVDKATGTEILRSDGSQITATKEFTADSADGAVKLTFTVDSNDLAGRIIVAFEDLSNDYGIIATHKDLNDEDQTTYIPEIRTAFAGPDGEKDFLAEGTQTIVDTVTYQGLFPCSAEDYRLAAVLMDKSVNTELLDQDGNPITAEVRFAPKAPEGSVEVVFTIDSCDSLAGHTIVAFETLYFKDEKITEHKDIDDSDQTVQFPKIGTVLTADNGTHVSYPGSFEENGTPRSLMLTDMVDYVNLIPGSTYVLEGILMDKKTGQAYRDRNANHITASASFTPEQPDGQVELTFQISPEQIDPESLTDNTLVAFESLYQNERKVAEHEDLTDEEQSLHFPAIRTSARAEDGTHTASLEYDSSEVEITDTVTYRNLVPGLKYKLIGTLMDCENQGILRKPDGNPIIAEKEFLPDKANGTVDVVFQFDAKSIIGKKAVVFESLMLGQTMLAEHKDIEDTEQMIQFPHLVRMFKYDASSGKGLAGAEFRVEDKGLSTSSEAVTLLEPQIVVSNEEGYFHFNSLPGHQYSVKEQKAPDGYLTAATEYIINVGEDGSIDGETEVPNVHGGTVVITKTDVITGTPLADCEISVYKASGGAKEPIFKQKTDGKGRIYFYTLEKGTYIYKETVTREGYYLNDEEFSFTIREDGSVEGDTRITNVPFGTVVIKKVDASGQPLKGAQLAFYDSNSRYLGQGVSDGKGRVYFVSPGPGDYYFTEVKAPEGYGLVTDKYSFRIAPDFAVSGTLKLVNTRTSTPYSKTGDTQNPGLWIAVTAISLTMALAAGGFLVIRKKTRKK